MAISLVVPTSSYLRFNSLLVPHTAGHSGNQQQTATDLSLMGLGISLCLDECELLTYLASGAVNLELF